MRAAMVAWIWEAMVARWAMESILRAAAKELGTI